MYQYVKTYIENGAGYIILNDPKKLNALSQPMAAELSEVLEQFRFDPQIGAKAAGSVQAVTLLL